jgi:hypothetical protein
MLKYHDILVQTSIRVNAVKGATEAVRITNLAIDPLTTTQIGSADFPFPVIQKSVLSGVARLMRVYAGLRNHPFRDFNTSQTAALTSGSAVPSVNSASKAIIGVPGAVRDGTISLTRQPKEMIDSINRSLANGNLKGPFYYYEIIDGRIIHTRSTVTIDVITFDQATEQTAVGTASGNSPLPDACIDLAWNAALVYLFTDDSYLAQSQTCNQYLNNELAAMAQGATSFGAPPDVSISK